MAKKSNTEEFIKKATEVHAGRYTYPETIYNGAKSYLKITCKDHGIFEQIPNNHLNGQGCPVCARYDRQVTQRYTTETFKDAAYGIHGDTYCYSMSEYGTSGYQKVKIICKEHGVFEQTPNSHLQGQGCPACRATGYKISKPGNLYILKTSCGITKVGITNRKVSSRLSKINSSSSLEFGLEMFIQFANGKHALQIETQILQSLRKTHESLTSKFDGSTECFHDVNKTYLLSLISEIYTNITTNKE